MKVAFLGYGNVGAPLADHLARLGHHVTLAAHDATSERLTQVLRRNPKLKMAAPSDAVTSADVVVLATPFHASEAVARALATELAGKILIDCTNPIGPGLTHALKSERSSTEMLQALLPNTKVVKAFNIYGAENFEDSSYPAYGVKPAMLFCGNDEPAKAVVAGLLTELGWEPLDVGAVDQALHLEHMTLMLLKMIYNRGYSQHTVWARLQR